MSAVIQLRNTYQKAFTEKHGIKLGFMSFFSMAAAIALKKFPQVNSQISGDEWVFFDYVDLGIAVQTDKGLMVPVIRNVEKMGLAEIEKEIARLAAKARSNRLSISEMEGGTFTITNGGVFGSLFSTPILNPPQAAILGMHNIVERPVAVNGKIEIRPMMYVALSYDHRIIDGKDSVSFLVKIKELIENPMLMLIDGDSVANRLLDL
jgi:2-oxoglutarate dehydrogenase E2 component (dihydrolipoamide succinyltransferase)